MVDFSLICFLFFFVFFVRGGGGGGGGRGGTGFKSNYYTNRLKLWLSIPRIVDDYPSNGTVLSIRSSKANSNVSNIAGFLLP